MIQSNSLSEAHQGPSFGGPGISTLADTYCAYCRQHGLTACIRRWCYGGRIAVLTTTSNADLRPGFGGFGAAPYIPRFGPGGSTLADIYCAYCRRYGLIACIRRWCYGRRILPQTITNVKPFYMF